MHSDHNVYDVFKLKFKKKSHYCHPVPLNTVLPSLLMPVKLVCDYKYNYYTFSNKKKITNKANREKNQNNLHL